ncbi:MAG: hypothetical protein RLZZ141_1912 [Pseudomonadota bacterium]
MRGDLCLELALDAHGAQRQVGVRCLDQEHVQTATEIQGPQGGVGNTQTEGLAEHFGLKRYVLTLEWLTLLPTIGPTPVSSQRRDIAQTFEKETWTRERLPRERGRYRPPAPCTSRLRMSFCLIV